MLDANQPDKGPASKGANHAYDCLAYALLSQPYAITAEDRTQQDHDSWREAYMEAREDLGIAVRDPYTTY